MQEREVEHLLEDPIQNTMGVWLDEVQAHDWVVFGEHYQLRKLWHTLWLDGWYVYLHNL